jgi:hypothetical protein
MKPAPTFIRSVKRFGATRYQKGLAESSGRICDEPREHVIAWLAYQRALLMAGTPRFANSIGQVYRGGRPKKLVA